MRNSEFCDENLVVSMLTCVFDSWTYSPCNTILWVRIICTLKLFVLSLIQINKVFLIINCNGKLLSRLKFNFQRNLINKPHRKKIYKSGSTELLPVQSNFYNYDIVTLCTKSWWSIELRRINLFLMIVLNRC